eukprot:TRINITY_DN6139_c0_g1_i1.p1 TRINITY_DN6139_c0_g1~~TRINITY_DN6139_c0_g1_i1.p1  ORF type:complete len:464 (-),score=150.14 TRINITY_DN6139_c0_g1_i1:296-1687(-)
MEAKSGPQLSGDAPVPVTGEVEEEDDAEAQKKQTEAMRLYQLQRTKYHYAVAQCDSPATASYLYDQLDGMEASGICPGTLDLRFVPDDLEFPHPPREEATEIPKRYAAPVIQQKSALGHSKVDCSWDEAPLHRKKDLMKKRFSADELREADLEAYLASSSGDESAGSGAEALKKLVKGEDDDDDGFFKLSGSEDEADGEAMGDMEATFSVTATNLEEKLNEKVQQQQGQHGGRKLTKLQEGEEKEVSVWQKFLDKKKQRKKEARAKAKAERESKKKHRTGENDAGADADDDDDEEAAQKELELLAADGRGEDDRGFNLRGKKRGEGGRAKVAGDDFKVDVNDPRISAVFNSADFEIDPTNPEFRGSAGMQAILKKKRTKKTKPQAVAQADAVAKPLPKELASAAKAATPSRSATDLGGLQLFGGKKRQQADAVTPSQAVRLAAADDAPGKKKKKRKTSAIKLA